MGKVALEGMEFYARHGYYEEERIVGNKYSVDVILDLDFKESALQDKLEGTVNYEKVYEIVQQVMSIDAHLLEHLAGKMIKSLKERFDQINAVEVKISKYNPPIMGLCKRAVVTMEG
ncbi:MAG: dihydroneopterin aldolase [Bacteroidota bacterium]